MSIVLDDANVSTLTKEFKNKLSKKPYCSDNLGYGLQIRSKQIALLRKYIQANCPHKMSWFVFDIDYPCILETLFKEKVLPLPNIVVINPENHHCHLLYGLKEGIYLTDNARIAPIRYAKSIEYALREELMADSGYTGLIIKNPQHNYWNTIELNEELWTLEELAEYLTLPKKLPKRENLIGLGRNCTLFELGRKYAYGEVLKHKITGNRETFYNGVLSHLEQQNQHFPNPLNYNEYKGIAKSISTWTWRHYGDRTSRKWKEYVKRTHSAEMQAYRGGKNTSEQQSIKGKKGAIKSAQVRSVGSNEETKPWEALGISRRTYYRRLKQSKET